VVTAPDSILAQTTDPDGQPGRVITALATRKDPKQWTP